MKHIAMRRRRGPGGVAHKRPGDNVGQDGGPDAATGSAAVTPHVLVIRAANTPVRTAFDVWMDEGLHALYDGVKDEPIPAELLRLIEEDRQK